MLNINPYLIFSGNCEEAFEFYKSVFGGEFDGLMRFKEVPTEGQGFLESEGEKIIHVALPIRPGVMLMGSDSPTEMGPTTPGDNVHLAIDAESKEEATRLFNGLAEGGAENMPLNDTFWGAYFGMCTDKFGVRWMVNYQYDQQE